MELLRYYNSHTCRVVTIIIQVFINYCSLALYHYDSAYYKIGKCIK